MSINVSSQYNTSSYATTRKSKSVNDYSKYLRNKFQCLTPNKNASVTVSLGLMRKAMSNEKTAGWLEKELSTIPDAVEAAQKAAIRHGSKLISVSIEYQEDCTVMSTCGIFGETGTDSEIDKWLEKIKEKKQEEKTEKERQEAVEEFYSHAKVVETYVDSRNLVTEAVKEEMSTDGYIKANSIFDVKA